MGNQISGKQVIILEVRLDDSNNWRNKVYLKLKFAIESLNYEHTLDKVLETIRNHFLSFSVDEFPFDIGEYKGFDCASFTGAYWLDGYETEGGECFPDIKSFFNCVTPKFSVNSSETINPLKRTPVVGDKVLIKNSFGHSLHSVIQRETKTLLITESGMRFSKKDMFGFGHKAYIKSFA